MTEPADLLDSDEVPPLNPRVPGNIDLATRPVVHHTEEAPDGSMSGVISTVRSASIGTPDGEVLIPTVSPDGRLLTVPEATELYNETGQHLGIFDSVESANTYAGWLHRQQAQQYGGSQ